MDAQTVLGQLEMLQRMVNINLATLQRLRHETASSSNSELIAQEVRTFEGKLMKLFSRQLVVKFKSGESLAAVPEQAGQYPNILHFLDVVGIDTETATKVETAHSTVEALCTLPDEKIRSFFRKLSHPNTCESPSDEYCEEAKRLIAALKILRFFTDRLKNGERAIDLKWESWYNTIPAESPSNDSRNSIASYLSVFSSQESLPSAHTNTKGKSLTLPVTKQQGSRSIPPSPTSPRKPATMTRSKSDEANVGRKVHSESGSSTSSFTFRKSKKRVQSKPTPLNLMVSTANTGESSYSDSEHSKSRSSSISQSPRTPTRLFHFGMGHSIKHRFSAKTVLVSLTCDYCEKMLFVGVKCKECGFKCHKKCSRKAPPSCGLPPVLEELFIKRIRQDQNSDVFKFNTLQSIKRTSSEPSNFCLHVDDMRINNRSHGDISSTVSDPYRDYNEPPHSVSASGDSCSTTSSASSVPSSPALHGDSPPSGSTPSYNVQYYIQSPQQEHFYFPGAEIKSPSVLVENHNGLETETLTGTANSYSTFSSTLKSEESTDTLIHTEGSSQSKTSSGTKSTESTISGNEDCSVDNLDSQISDMVPQHVKLRGSPLSKSDKVNMLLDLHERGSLMSEWVIPFNEIELGDLIGKGRLGQVYKAKWHGEVAVKILHVENPSEEERNAFKYKVQTFRKTRHENLVLFMGACMDPPTLAIVTSLCKGFTLFQHIHVRNTQLDDNRIVSIITQIAQGMSYLHARRIVHKDLKTKNVFLENNRVVITDFGLLTVADLSDRFQRKGWLCLPRYWLCYQAPEIVRQLDPSKPGCEASLYTEETDVYAFGTVWYELLSRTWPLGDQETEPIIWQVGKGFKQSFNGLEISRDVKDILSLCWEYNPESRPRFNHLLKAFERLPKKKLTRNLSQPMSLTRSADALILY